MSRQKIGSEAAEMPSDEAIQLSDQEAERTCASACVTMMGKVRLASAGFDTAQKERLA